MIPLRILFVAPISMIHLLVGTTLAHDIPNCHAVHWWLHLDMCPTQRQLSPADLLPRCGVYPVRPKYSMEVFLRAAKPLASAAYLQP